MTRRSLLTWLAALALIVLFLPRAGSAVAAAPVTLAGTVPAVVAHAQPVGTRPTSDIMSLTVSLSLRDRAGLLGFIKSLNDPTSPYYHHPLSQAQANQLFNPTAAEEAQVVSWLQSHGLTVTQTYPNHLMVDAQGTVGQVEAMLNLTINSYQVTTRGKVTTFYAPDRNPTIDGSVSGIVQAINGLDSFPRFHTNLVKDTNGTAHSSPAYLPQDFANAYDVNPLWNAGYTGAGQSIGITLWEIPPSDAVLQQFHTNTGANVATVANGRLHVKLIGGGSTLGDDGEAGMDIEESSDQAPAATINYYEAPTDSNGNPTDQGLLDALNMAGTDGNKQITNSWGGCEASSAGDVWTQAAENIFAANAATGHTYFFSSGDNGSWCDPNNDGTGIDPYPNYPASSPNVTSVGGTAFSRAINGVYPGETTWLYSATGNNGYPEGTGGGYSNIFNRPTWQTGTGLAANGKRGYPDIAADADPNTGAYVCYGSSPNISNDTCYSPSGTCKTGFESVCYDWIGGTSLSSPLWAGMTALLNQYLAAQGKNPVGFLAPDLYTLAKSAPYAPFHDIITGTNGVYHAASKWDAVTGWGSPDLYNIARDLFAIGGGVSGGGGGGTPPGTNVLVNGDFETGPGAPWIETSKAGNELISTQGKLHAGSYAARLCGYNSCSDLLKQSFTVPSKVTSAVLTYWIASDTAETYTACYDRLMTQFRNAAGTLLSTPASACNANSGWVQKTVNLTAFLKYRLNQTLQLSFQGTSNTLRPTSFYIDDVQLLIS